MPRPIRSAILLLVLACLSSATLLPAQPTISYRNGEVRLVPAEPTTTLAVFRGQSSTPLLGRRSLRGDTLIFRPLVDFTFGETYVAKSAVAPPLRFQVSLPADYRRAYVRSHHPTAAVVPSNLLKIHLLFSRPMQGGGVYPHLALVGPDGDTLRRAILPLDPPLWNTDRTALTLWLEPGRIKRELGPNQRLGPILVPEQSYQLHVDGDLRDANGQPLLVPYTFSFSTGPPDTLRPTGEWWLFDIPATQTRSPLYIDTREKWDWATATHYLSVRTADQRPFAGTWHLEKEGSRMVFTPFESWRTGRYELWVDPRLEDLAGNNWLRLFDRPTGSADQPDPGASRFEFRIHEAGTRHGILLQPTGYQH